MVPGAHSSAGAAFLDQALMDYSTEPLPIEYSTPQLALPSTSTAPPGPAQHSVRSRAAHTRTPTLPARDKHTGQWTSQRNAHHTANVQPSTQQNKISRTASQAQQVPEPMQVQDSATQHPSGIQQHYTTETHHQVPDLEPEAYDIDTEDESVYYVNEPEDDEQQPQSKNQEPRPRRARTGKQLKRIQAQARHRSIGYRPRTATLPAPEAWLSLPPPTRTLALPAPPPRTLALPAPPVQALALPSTSTRATYNRRGTLSNALYQPYTKPGTTRTPKTWQLLPSPDTRLSARADHMTKQLSLPRAHTALSLPPPPPPPLALPAPQQYDAPDQDHDRQLAITWHPSTSASHHVEARASTSRDQETLPSAKTRTRSGQDHR